MLFLTRLAVVATVVSVATAAPGPVVKRVNPCKPDENIVPWDPKYGTGLIPAGFESCLASQLGPTFLNPFYQSTPDIGLGSCFGSCALTVVKELPCIAKAIATENPLALLGCGIGKTDICACLKCLPSSVYKYVQAWCESSAGEGVAATNEYSDDNFIANADDNLKAFLGFLTGAELQALKDSAATAPTSPNNGTASAILACPIGGACGSCCCIGLCVFGACIGGCV